jgi:altronate dehydratase
MVNALLIHPADTVAVALRDLAAGEQLTARDADLGGVVAHEAVPFGHKVAVRPIASGTQVIKYGAHIGLTTRDIAPGEHVHTHNLVSVRGAVQR